MVLDYYEYTWDKMGGVDYRNMFKLCAQITLRTDAILHIYGPTFTKVIIFHALGGKQVNNGPPDRKHKQSTWPTDISNQGRI